MGQVGACRRRTNLEMKKHPAHGAHARARALRHDMTRAERRIWQILSPRQVKGHSFAAKCRSAATLLILFCHEARLIVEMDGGQHDRSSCREAARTAFLQNEG